MAIEGEIITGDRFEAVPNAKISTGVPANAQVTVAFLAADPATGAQNVIYMAIDGKATAYVLTRELFNAVFRRVERRIAAGGPLPAADLRRLGVAVVPPGDVVVTQPQAADPVKTAEAILNAWAPADGAETADA